MTEKQISKIGTQRVKIGIKQEKVRDVLNTPIKARKPKIYPKSKEPQSPIKIFAWEKLYFRNPIQAPNNAIEKRNKVKDPVT